MHFPILPPALVLASVLPTPPCFVLAQGSVFSCPCRPAAVPVPLCALVPMLLVTVLPQLAFLCVLCAPS
jgi:hypothetical protein